MRAGLMAAVALVVALAPVARAETPPKGSPSASAPRLHSQLRAYEITALTVLPRAPAAEGPRCSAAPPQSVPARELAAAGWHVAQEADFGPYRAVLFAAEARPEGAVCQLGDSNLGLFLADRLQAVVWSAFEEAPALSAMALVAPTRLRLSSGDLLVLPEADLLLEADGGLLLTALPEIEPVCDGGLRLPRAWGLPLRQARGALLAAGWQPVVANASAMAGEFAALGLPEGEDCAGSGLQMCSFLYAQGAARLQVTTYGGFEEAGPRIADYHLDCGPPP